ncbi:MAG: sodium-dependent transporter [Sutterellaceae bacterium]|nr:sodium-dependent transporter [Sutterellaceae bacterium]
MANRSTWASQIGFILSSVGAAVGLGAIWKFPYLAGSNGGSAFFLPYLVLTFTVGVVLLIAEITLGRVAKGSIVPAYRTLGGKGFLPFAYMGIVTGFLVMSFYSAVGGWTIAYFFEALAGSGIVADKASLGAHFAGLVSNPVSALGLQALFLALTALVVCRDVSAGIERLNKVLLPLFLALRVVVIIRGVTLPGAMKGVSYLFSFDAGRFTAASLFQAMGFMFFSLCVGCGCMLAYGSYLSERVNVVRSCFWITFLSLLASVLGGLMVMPAVFAFGLDPAAGPGLTFVTMPIVFAQLPFGSFFAALFYLCLIFAALTSAVSLMEIIVSWCVDELRVTRGRATIYVSFALMLTGSLCSLSFGPLSGTKVFGKTFFDLADFLSSNIGLPVGGLVLCAVAGFFAWPQVKDVLLRSGLSKTAASVFRFILTVASPAVILIVLVGGLV